MNMSVIPSIISDDMHDLKEKLEMARSVAKEVQIDFFDGVYVPNYKSIGPSVFQNMNIYMDMVAHILAFEPEHMVEDLILAGFKRIIFHLETTDHAEEIIEKANQKGVEIGVAIDPETDVAESEKYVGRVSEHMFLAVNPKHPGIFIPDVLDSLRTMRKSHPLVRVSVDGGISADNIEEICFAGADIAYVGSAVFDHGAPEENFKLIAEKVDRLKAS